MGDAVSAEWTAEVTLAELTRGPRTFELSPDEAERARIAKRLDLVSLPSLNAVLRARPWLDGVELVGRLEAVVEQTCGVTLEAFEQPLAVEFDVRVVPEGSPNAPAEEDGEALLDLDAPDPPDVSADGMVDLAEYVIEHLALELDPFPRKPGVEFEFDPGAEDDSPFTVLKRLQTPKD